MGIKQYIKDTRGEFVHVSWPTRAQAVSFTVFVIVLSLGVALYLGLFDYIFSAVLQNVITK